MEDLVASLDAYRGKRILITGNTGFKGSWLQRMLEMLGASCYGYALEPNTNPSHFALLELGNTTFGDVRKPEQLESFVEQVDPQIVFHLAAQPLVRYSYQFPGETYETNVMGTLNLLQTLRARPNLEAVVIITTDKVYENLEWNFPYREIDRLGGHDMYSSSKACTEILVSSFAKSFYSDSHVRIATARAGNVIGGGDWSTDRLVPDIVKATSNKESVEIRNPQAVRPWQHVLECLHGYLLLGIWLLNQEDVRLDSWNFAPHNSERLNVGELVELAASVWPAIKAKASGERHAPHEAGLLRLDNSKAMTQLNWSPRMGIKKSLEWTINWYRKYYEEGVLDTDKQIQEYLDGIQ